MIDKEKFATLIGILEVVYGEKVSPEKIDIYHECLEDIPIDVLHAGVIALLKTRKYPKFPTIGEIRERCIGSEEDVEAAALTAWKTAITRYHGNGDLMLNETIALAFGGWDRFDATFRENEVSDRAHFIKCYKAVARRNSGLMLGPGAGGEKKLLTNGPDEPK